MWRKVTCLSVLLVCATLAAGDCDIVGEDGNTYKEVVLARGLNDPRKLVVDWENNTLLFNHYYIGQRVSAALDIGRKEYHNIDNFVNVWCSHTVHQHRGGLYVGCTNQNGRGGIYHFDTNKGDYEMIGLGEENVEFVHYSKNELYYSIIPSWRVYSWSQGVSRPMSQVADTTVRRMVVDKAGDWVYQNNTALCRLKVQTGRVQCIESSKDEVMLAVGPSGIAFVCDTLRGGIYSVEEDASLTKVVDAPDCLGLAIDGRDNFIYSNSFSIIQLKKC